MTKKLHAPNSTDWFDAMHATDPAKAYFSLVTVARYGVDGCSVCGDTPSQPYRVKNARFRDGSPMTLRLCDDCLKIRRHTMFEQHERIAA